MNEARRNKGRLTLLLIVLVFLLPVVAAYLYRPAGAPGNYGTLVEPPRPLRDFEMTGLEGANAGLDDLKGKWTLLYRGGKNCLEQCQSNLYKIERVRLSQGKNMARVQSLYLAPDSVQGRVVADTLLEYAGVQGYRISPADSDAMLPGYDWAEAGESAPYSRIYLIDPLGNLMMYYSGDADPSGMKKDLERLLKVSQIG